MADPLNPYDLDEARRRQAEERENVRLKIQNLQQRDYDQALRVLSVQMTTGLPGEVVEASLPELEAQVGTSEFNVDKWRKESPAWTTFASKNPYHLAVLKDDQENMTTFERSWNALELGATSTFDQVELGRLQARRATGDHKEGDEERIAALMQTQVGHEFGAPNWFAKFLVKNVKMAGPTLYSLAKGAELALAGGVAAGTTAAVLGQLGPQAAFPEEFFTVPAATVLGASTAFVTGRSLAAMELETGFAYQEYIDAGLDHETASYAAHAVGLVNAGLESFSLGVTTKYIPGFRGAKKAVADILKRPSMRRATTAATLRFGEVLGTEVVTEAMQETVTAVTGDVIGGQPLTYEMWVDRVSEVMLETLQGAAIMSSFGPGASYYRDMRRAQDGKLMQAAFEALGESAKDSKTRQNLPDKYREFVEFMTEKGQLKNLVMEVEAFDEYWQKQDMDPDEVALTLGIKAEELQKVRDAGSFIEIPINKYAENIAPTEHHAGMYPDLKRNADTMSLNESKEWYANADEIQKAMADQAAPEGHETNLTIRDAILGQLLAIPGSEYSAALKQATLQEYIYTTLAERNNKDPMVLFERYFRGVYKEGDPALMKGAEDIDMMVDPLLDRLRTGDVPSQRDIFGQSLIDFIKARGGMQDVGGELSARDVQKSVRGFIKDTGASLDAAAEMAAEAGFIAERDPNLLLDAIDQELRGDPVFALGVEDEGLARVGHALEELGRIIGEEGLDLDELTNAQVRARLEAGTTFRQDKTPEEVNEMLELAILSAATDPAMMRRAMTLLSEVSDEQDFGQLTFADKVRVTGFAEGVEIEASAQQVFDKSVKRREAITKLLDCVNG